MLTYMGELIGITGKIGSGKSTFAEYLGEVVEDHAIYETSGIIIEVANSFNQLLEAELNYALAEDKIELTNQALIWMPDIINQVLHHNVTWTQIAINPKDVRVHPEIYEKLFKYLEQILADNKIAELTITQKNKRDYRYLLQWLGAYFVAKISKTIWYDEILRRIDLHDPQTSLVIINGVRYKSDAACVSDRGGRVISIARSSEVADANDPTETEQSLIDADITVYNNGTLKQLQRTAENLWDDIASGNPKSQYGAK